MVAGNPRGPTGPRSRLARTLAKLLERARRARRRIAKRAATLARRTVRPAPGPPRVIFVVGCQRSGTDMLTEVLDRSPDVRLFQESADSDAFTGYRLRPLRDVLTLVDAQAVPLVALKPLCDSQHTDRLLEAFPGARAIWVFRGFKDVANSAVKKWGDHQRAVMEQIVRRDYRGLGWRSERITEGALHDLDTMQAGGWNDHDGAAAFWYWRNSLFFDQKLHADQRVLLVRYEDLVTEPGRTFPKLFDFLGCEFRARYIGDVRRRSVGRDRYDGRNDVVTDFSERMMARLDQEIHRAPDPQRSRFSTSLANSLKDY